MEWKLTRRILGRTRVFCFFYLLFSTAGGETSTLTVSSPHQLYSCPEGATAKLVCNQRGAAKHPTDVLRPIWLFTPHSEKHCSGSTGPRNIHHRSNHTLPPGLHFGHGDHNLWIVLQNVTRADQGRYCCMLLDTVGGHQHVEILQKPHSHIILHVTARRNGTQNCTVLDPTPTDDSVPVVLAIAACLLAVVSLPLILVLVYKQRQTAQSSRRAQELVRMDSEAIGHENPVFLGGSPHTKTRTVSQIMTRQSSETGRHLLSEPGTPLSPPAHGDVFFPSEDTIPESPDFLQI
ncbi:V-type immunoglobulin domain-containing suppressor of T-cell activation [Salarias fasciatus]|uniref:V-set immunoregulatory receptor n=1 Tax=Salarias fasciatus TaxID=181472 RepID=A0A672GVY9_SALFA|nr:V-type immunoglobulin domain-containing suppressor of T-cell activation [Salarias fasciatus]